MAIGAPRALLVAALLLASASIGGAWFSELVLGYVPCKLCLWQRIPYYVGLPVLALALATRGRLAGGLTALGAAVFAVSIGLGIYHSGVEWAWWAGPADCGGKLVEGPGSVLDFRKSLEKARVVLCNEAPMRVLGLSFAGWNAVASAMVTALLARAAFARRA